MADDGLELRWPGKYGPDGARVPLPRARPTPRFASVERHAESPEAPVDVLVHGDNLRWLDSMLGSSEGLVDLVYMDPPFATGKRFSALRPVGESGAAVELPAYDDTFAGGVGEYLAMLDPRVRMIHALLADHGSLYVHVDANVGPAVKLLLDDVFGAASFQREIIWRIGWVSGFKTRARNWIRNHDCIYFYAKDPARMRFNKQYVPHPPGYQRRAGAPAKSPGIAVDDVWNASDAARALRGPASLDSIQIKSFSREKTGWATQKNASLLRRIVAASSNPGDRVVDPFSGSGTTAVVAASEGRRFAVCDRSGLATLVARNRLLDAGHRAFSIHVEERGAGSKGEPGGTPRAGASVDAAGRVTLESFDAEDWPDALHDVQWCDRVEAWGVVDEAGTVRFEAHREGSDRTLRRTSPPGVAARPGVAGPRGDRLFAWDVLGRRAEVPLAPDHD